ncbi:hypothetical protein NEIRO03_1832 [Nematocida sp. AWRm78]|nr:hypothetical protein NEIRO02_1867 [Nematocida sp. AWRm79]KAI5184709.1 hypothetical protein NEIRO03_1832 [Nematocida sp. AWRm78]
MCNNSEKEDIRPVFNRIVIPIEIKEYKPKLTEYRPQTMALFKHLASTPVHPWSKFENQLEEHYEELYNLELSIECEWGQLLRADDDIRRNEFYYLIQEIISVKKYLDHCKNFNISIGVVSPSHIVTKLNDLLIPVSINNEKFKVVNDSSNKTDFVLYIVKTPPNSTESAPAVYEITRDENSVSNDQPNNVPSSSSCSINIQNNNTGVKKGACSACRNLWEWVLYIITYPFSNIECNESLLRTVVNIVCGAISILLGIFILVKYILWAIHAFENESN